MLPADLRRHELGADTANGWTAGKGLRYPDGVGRLDSEGVTLTDAGSAGRRLRVLRAEPRRSPATPPASILRYDVSGAGTTLTATHEWNLTAATCRAGRGANLGLESVEWVPDSYLVASGFIDESTAPATTRRTTPTTAPGCSSSASRPTASSTPTRSTDRERLHARRDVRQRLHHVRGPELGARDEAAVGGVRQQLPGPQSRLPGRHIGGTDEGPLRRRRRTTTGRRAWPTSTTRASRSRRTASASAAASRSSGPTTATPTTTRCAPARSTARRRRRRSLPAGPTPRSAPTSTPTASPISPSAARRTGARARSTSSRGSALGVTGSGSQLWTQPVGISDVAEDGDEFGAALAVGDYNGDTRPDLAIGAPGENDGAGTVHVLLRQHQRAHRHGQPAVHAELDRRAGQRRGRRPLRRLPRRRRLRHHGQLGARRRRSRRGPRRRWPTPASSRCCRARRAV